MKTSNRYTYEKLRGETLTVDSREENMLFRTYFGHFGDHLEYANVLFNFFCVYLTRDTYDKNESLTINKKNV